MKTDTPDFYAPPFSDAFDTATLTFLGHQIYFEHLLLQSIGGIFPELSSLDLIHDVLDISCGAGNWALEAARTYESMNITGIDRNPVAIDFANMLAQVQTTTNVRFKVMNPSEPLHFPDNSFDLVNATSLSWLEATKATWPGLLKEYFRVTRPGGILRFNELEVAISNSPANQKMFGSFVGALHASGLTYSVDGRTIGIAPKLIRLLRETGCASTNHVLHGIDISYGSDLHEGWAELLVVIDKLLTPFVTKSG